MNLAPCQKLLEMATIDQVGVRQLGNTRCEIRIAGYVGCESLPERQL